MTEIKVENYPRQFGSSKYGISRLFNGVMDLMTVLFISRYSKRPLHFFGIPGLASLLFGFFIDAFLVVQGFFITGKIGHTALLIMGVMLIIIGIQFISLGLLRGTAGYCENNRAERPAYKRNSRVTNSGVHGRVIKSDFFSIDFFSILWTIFKFFRADNLVGSQRSAF